MVVSFLYIVPTHLSTVLFAVVAKDPSQLRTKLRFTLKLSAGLGVAGMLVLIVAASPVMHIFGSGYASAVVAMQLLALGYLPTTVKLHYIAVSRATNRIGHAAWVLGIGGALELGCAAVGASWGGLTGLTIGYLIACCTEAVITGPTVARGAVRG
jgi:O-antigen/teichoic acid export membrane protein